jgi:hypothetical protein
MLFCNCLSEKNASFPDNSLLYVTDKTLLRLDTAHVAISPCDSWPVQGQSSPSSGKLGFLKGCEPPDSSAPIRFEQPARKWLCQRLSASAVSGQRAGTRSCDAHTSRSQWE